MESNMSQCTDNQSKAQADTERQIIASKYADMHVVCSPIRYGKTVQGLRPGQKAAVAKKGLGGMLHMKPITLRRIMLVEIVQRYIVEKGLFLICGTELPMTISDVYHIMGIPIEGKEIAVDNNTRINQHLFHEYRSKTTRENQITIKGLEDSIRNSQVADDHFIRQFVLYTIGVILAPTSKGYVDSKYLALVENVDDIPKFNWGQLTLTNLLSCIRSFKQKEAKNLQGNLVLLQYWYWEHVHAYGRHGVLYSPVLHPLMERWDEKNAKLRSDAYEADNLDGGVVVVTLNSPDAPSKATDNETTENVVEQSHPQEGPVRVQHSEETNIILQSMTKTRLSMERTVMQSEHKLYSLILTLQEQVADQSIEISALKSYRRVQEEAYRKDTCQKEVFEKSNIDLDKEAGKEKLSTLQEPGKQLHEETSAKKHIPSKLSKIDQDKHVGKEKLGKLKEPSEGESSTGAKSMLASKPLLRKTGGRDIYDQHSLHYLYTNDKLQNNSTEYLVFGNDYILSEDDKKVVEFIKHSYEYAVVADIADIALTVKFLKPNVLGGWLYDTVIDAYAYIANVETDYRSVLTTVQSRELAGENGEFDPKKEKKWIGNVGKRCVFIPFLAWGCHWCLLVLNKRRKEIQILNSLDSIPQLRNEKMETTLVESLQVCIEYAVEAGLIAHTESIDLTTWSKHYYTNIPQQGDRVSCGVYVIKYTLEWNGVEMSHNFTQAEMDIFRRKVCCRLLYSECNKSRRQSYEEPIMKEEYLSQNPKGSMVGHAKNLGDNDDVYIISSENGNNKNITGEPSAIGKGASSQSQKKRGRPRKDAQDTKAAKKQTTLKNTYTVTKRVRGENCRVSNPSQYQKSPYKQL